LLRPEADWSVGVTDPTVGATRSGQSDVVSSIMVTLRTGRIWDAGADIQIVAVTS
jgi:hypothetical protein